MSVILVIIILVVLIIVHELGHFVAAKVLGVKVEEFGVGYPPRAFTFGKWKDTEYTLNWLPFGGFVRLFGEDPDAQKIRGSFVGSSRPRQAIILFAGVFMNAVAAWVLFTSGFVLGMPAPASSDAPGAQVLVSGVLAGTPADDAGILVGDEIRSIIADDGTGAENITPDGIAAFVADHGGDEVTVTYMRENEAHTAVLTPAHAVIEVAAGRPTMGVQLTSIAQVKLPLPAAMLVGAKYTVYSLKTVVTGLYSLAVDAFRGSADIKNLVGPVGLVGVVGDAAGHGLGHLLGLAAFISVNLAIINLIPIPALDGGRLVFVGIEAIARRRIPMSVFGTLNALGFALIIFLMLAVTYNDIARVAG